MKIPKIPVIYVTKSRERAEGLAENEHYEIVSGDDAIDTLELLGKPETAQKINAAKAAVLVFKNTKQIEELAQKNSWELLNPSAELAETIENKITQVGWLGDLADLLPPHHITLVKKIVREINKDTSSIVQWAHSHTGEGTIHIQKESDLKIIQSKFPEREARVTTFIKGPMFTANIVVSENKILIGNISYQITGLAPFTENPFSTVGNDWSIPYNILSEKHLEEFTAIGERVGKKLQSSGWKGLFGIDVVYDEERDKLFLIEINARQPASTTFESHLQEKTRAQGVPGITIFEAHLLALTDSLGSDSLGSDSARDISGETSTNETTAHTLIQINDGAQIVQRVTSLTKEIDSAKLSSIEKIRNAGFDVITYKNSKANNDLIRIQSDRGIMESHNKLNTRGKLIVELLG
jgi:predicted ATP-grasp superfamily ATP-dependent carboligase